MQNLFTLTLAPLLSLLIVALFCLPMLLLITVRFVDWLASICKKVSLFLKIL